VPSPRPSERNGDLLKCPAPAAFDAWHVEGDRHAFATHRRREKTSGRLPLEDDLRALTVRAAARPTSPCPTPTAGLAVLTCVPQLLGSGICGCLFLLGISASKGQLVSESLED